ncbi:hypothetical protein O181_103290 [Austropuccinia psidii MF-1]|uniref:Uncharacterized protein n=1 Tax=Austropuccinia psidii MF-1 TaxID=1389203 RepID=A0A9Q3JLB8_9BASI|nr:hypothetical protein [Austropuccinia psidii MF-1]
MSSKLTSICDSDHSDSPPSILYGSGVFDNLRELSEESMALKRFGKSIKPIMVLNLSELLNHPASIVGGRGFLVLNLLLPGPPGANSATLEKETALRPITISQKIPEDYGEALRRVEDSGWKLLLMNLQLLMPPLVTPIVPILVTSKDGKLGKLKRNLVVQDEIDTDAEGRDEIYGEEHEMTTSIQKRRIQSPSQSPVQASTTNNEVIRSLQPSHPHLPLPLPVSNHLWPALPDTQCLQKLNESLKPIAAGI